MESFGIFLVLSLLFGHIRSDCGRHIRSTKTKLNAELSPNITWISKEQIKNVGDSVVFKCVMPNLRDYSHMWRKNKNEIISHLSSIQIRRRGYSVRDRGNSYILRIRKIQESHAGNYDCFIIVNDTVTITGVIPLHVRKEPYITDYSTFSMTINEHDDIQLECDARGFPVPTISWRRDNNASFPNGEKIYKGDVLRIPKASKEYRGRYYCIAENGVGHASTREIPVGIRFAPIIEVPRPRVGQALGYDADLVCRVESFPRSNVVWKKNGEVLSTGKNYTISNFDSNEKYMDSILRVEAIKKSQYGEYTCVMQNGVGTAEKKVELFETDTPICRVICVENNGMVHNGTAITDSP